MIDALALAIFVVNINVDVVIDVISIFVVDAVAVAVPDVFVSLFLSPSLSMSMPLPLSMSFSLLVTWLLSMLSFCRLCDVFIVRLDFPSAVIIVSILLTNNDMTPASRRFIHYQIGLTGLPVVGTLTPCDKVLDYVSSWEPENRDD